MDPLAILTGVITLCGALLATLNVIKSACGASDEICALINEVSDTQIVLKSIEPLLPSTFTYNPSGDVPGLLKFVQDAKSTTTKLQVVVDRCMKKETKGIPKVKRARWIKEKSKAADLRAEMYRIRSNITSLLIADTRSVKPASEIEPSISQLSPFIYGNGCGLISLQGVDSSQSNWFWTR